MSEKEYAQSPFEDFVMKPTHGFMDFVATPEDNIAVAWGTAAWGGRAPGDEVRPATGNYEGTGEDVQ